MFGISATASNKEEGSSPQKIPIWVLLKTPTGLAAALTLAVTAAAAGFIEPMLARQLSILLGLPINGVGIIWALYNLVYTGGGMVLGYWGEKMQPKKIMAMGLLLMGLSFFLLGPIPWLNFIHFSPAMAWVMEIGGLSGISVGCALAMVPAMPLMLKVIAKGNVKEGQSRQGRKPGIERRPILLRFVRCSTT